MESHRETQNQRVFRTLQLMAASIKKLRKDPNKSIRAKVAAFFH
jgi:hypothetical protein